MANPIKCICGKNLTGRFDVIPSDQRRPAPSVNFVTHVYHEDITPLEPQCMQYIPELSYEDRANLEKQIRSKSIVASD